jgi:hypothetical protein
MVIIPTLPYYSYTEQVTIENVVYILRFNWNYRQQSWHLDVFDKDKVLLVSGIRLVKGLNILRPYQYLPIPLGEILIGEDGNPYGDVADGALGTTAFVYYATEEESATV